MWLEILILIITVSLFAALSAATGVILGIDWHSRRRVRDLKRKAADITAALDHDSR